MPPDSLNGFSNSASASDQSSALAFVLRRALGKMRTSTIVQVVAVSNTGGVSPVGTVDIQPLVHQTDGAGNITALPVVYGVPYLRIQGGANAIILDPQVGDLGIATFADRDLSAVKATKAAAAPGSSRRNSLADALYLGGILNGTPQQYVRFSTDGVEIVSPTKIHLQAPNIEADASTQFKVVSPDIQLQGAVHITGAQTNDSTITAQGDVMGNGTSLHTHKHSGVTSGGSQSGPPV